MPIPGFEQLQESQAASGDVPRRARLLVEQDKAKCTQEPRMLFRRARTGKTRGLTLKLFGGVGTDALP